MKRNYIKPVSEGVMLATQGMLAGSTFTTPVDEENTIEIGGMQTNGTDFDDDIDWNEEE